MPKQTTQSQHEQNKQMKDEQNQVRHRMSQIKHKILVLSGKGGVGKSTVAANMAVSLSLSGKRVGLLDIDIHGPSVPQILNLKDNKLMSMGDAIMPVPVSTNLVVMSIGFMLQDKDSPVIWRGPMKYQMIKQFLKDVEWGQLDYLIIDSPPGTGDEPLSIIQLLEKSDGAVIVTTPQQVALCLQHGRVADVARRVTRKLSRFAEPDRTPGHDQDTVTQPQGLERIVGNEQDGPPREHAPGQVLEAEFCDRIEARKRLVHEHDGPILHQGPGKGDALTHTAGERVRQGVLPAIKPYLAKQLKGPATSATVAGLTAQPAAEQHVLDHRQPGIEAVTLAHQGDSAFERMPIRTTHRAAVGRPRLEAQDQAQQGAFANAAGTEQAGQAACLESHIETLEQRGPVEIDASRVYGYGKNGRRIFCGRRHIPHASLRRC